VPRLAMNVAARGSMSDVMGPESESREHARSRRRTLMDTTGRAHSEQPDCGRKDGEQ